MRIYAVLSSTLLLSLVAFCQGEPSYKPAAGYVPDSKTAIAIAEAVLIPVYGEKNIESERPFTATRKHDVWTVEGALNCPGGKTSECAGGVAVVRISKSDGRILHMMHGK